MVFQTQNPFPIGIYDNLADGPRTYVLRTRSQIVENVERSL